MGIFDLLRGMGGHNRGGHGGGHGGGHHGGYGNYGGPPPSGMPPGNYGAPPSAPSGAPCAKCGTFVTAGARFCPQCGAAQAPTKCASCSADVPPAAKFCPGCGKPTAT